MSDTASKLEDRKPVHGTKARCYLKGHLTLKDGTPRYKIEVGTPKRPEVVHVESMGRTWVWVLVAWDREQRDFLMELSGVQLGISETGPDS